MDQTNKTAAPAAAPANAAPAQTAPAAAAPAAGTGFSFGGLLGIFTGLFKNAGESFKDAANKFSNAQFTWITFAVSVVIYTLAYVLETVISVAHVGGKAGWKWGNLENLKWGDFLPKQILGVAIVILAFAGVYFILCQIFKAKSDFNKLTGFASFAIILVALTTLLTTIVSIFSEDISVYIPTLGKLLAVTYVAYGFNSVTEAEGTGRFWINALTAIVLAVIYYIAVKLIFKDAMSSFSDYDYSDALEDLEKYLDY